MHPMLNIATSAARDAGNIILRNIDKLERIKIEVKAPNDFVTQVDRKAEEVILEALQKAYPQHGILAEESGRQNEDSEYQWIIDPLDGTTNFLHGFPQYAVSIGLQYRGRMEVAVVFDPIKNELFTAARGDGAQLNDRRLRVTQNKGLRGALLGTGFPFKQPQHLDAYLETFKAVHADTAGIRRAGSAALDLAYVAAGRLDGFWEIGLSPWDMAAGVLLIREAGGIITDFSGEGNYLKTGNIVAAASTVYPALYEAIKPHFTADLK
ncbi:Inositol-1-monophosphatase [hydrothermal vent metagenome]|uniref:inositol-phosphate phosphatase n=1 Tax=hydrothermal vent metagenome TaxID=652676 RepID=A0A3B0X7U0_9ZZZZ